MPDTSRAPRLPAPARSLAALHEQHLQFADFSAQIEALTGVSAYSDLYIAVWIEELHAVGGWALCDRRPGGDRLLIGMIYDCHASARRRCIDLLRAHLASAGHREFLIRFLAGDSERRAA